MIRSEGELWNLFCPSPVRRRSRVSSATPSIAFGPPAPHAAPHCPERTLSVFAGSAYEPAPAPIQVWASRRSARPCRRDIHPDHHLRPYRRYTASLRASKHPAAISFFRGGRLHLHPACKLAGLTYGV